LDGQLISESDALARADVLVLASEGLRPTPGTLVRALARGVIPVTSRLAVYEELLAEGEYGFDFEPGEVDTLAAHLVKLISDPALRERSRAQTRALVGTFAWSRVVDEFEHVYGDLVRRRHDVRAD